MFWYTIGMTKDTVLIRVSSDSRALLQHIGDIEGRQQGWLADKAITYYCMNYDAIQAEERREANEVRNNVMAEGIRLGKLPDRPRDAEGNYEHMPDPVVEPLDA